MLGRVRTLREVLTEVENSYYLLSTNDSMSPFQIEHYHKYSNSTLLWQIASSATYAKIANFIYPISLKRRQNVINFTL